MKLLRLRRNVVKLSLYRHFTNTLIFAIIGTDNTFFFIPLFSFALRCSKLVCVGFSLHCLHHLVHKDLQDVYVSVCKYQGFTKKFFCSFSSFSCYFCGSVVYFLELSHLTV